MVEAGLGAFAPKHVGAGWAFCLLKFLYAPSLLYVVDGRLAFLCFVDYQFIVVA